MAGRCPNLLHEAAPYRYSNDPTDRAAEISVDEHNHALAALRYLVIGLDAHHRACPRRPVADSPIPPALSPAPTRVSAPLDHTDRWVRFNDPSLRTRLL